MLCNIKYCKTDMKNKNTIQTTFQHGNNHIVDVNNSDTAKNEKKNLKNFYIAVRIISIIILTLIAIYHFFK